MSSRRLAQNPEKRASWPACNMIYIGQIKRLVQTRVLEHINEAESVRKSDNPHINPAAAEYVIEQGHHLSLNNVDILKEVDYIRKLDSYESLHLPKIPLEKKAKHGHG